MMMGAVKTGCSSGEPEVEGQDEGKWLVSWYQGLSFEEEEDV